MKVTGTLLATLLPLVSAHFELTSPPPRGLNENNMGSFPCGGLNTVSSQRTDFPLTNGSVTINLGHISTNVEVLLAIGDSPGGAFNTIIRRPFLATGLGPLCISDLNIPSNITAGTKATIQVQTNGDPSGGLYACTDITFIARSPDAQVRQCTPGAIQIGTAEVSGHPNGTSFAAAAGGDANAVTPTTSGTASVGSTPTPTTSKAPNAAAATGAGMGGLIAAAAGVVAMVL